MKQTHAERVAPERKLRVKQEHATGYDHELSTPQTKLVQREVYSYPDDLGEARH